MSTLVYVIVQLANAVTLVFLLFSIRVFIGLYRRTQPVVSYTPVAQILPRPLPAHVQESRILVNGTEIQFNDDRELCPAIISGYHREPGRGNYYLVTHPNIRNKFHRKWVPDTCVWEEAEAAERAA